MAILKKLTCTRLLKSDTGHRVYKHESKCSHPHGHEYRYEVTAEADELDSVGRIIDFSVLKEKIGGWIDDNWDHSFLVFKDDVSLIKALSSVEDSKPPVVVDWNPTAENIASHLLLTVCPMVLSGTAVRVTKIKVWETENCFAEASL